MSLAEALGEGALASAGRSFRVDLRCRLLLSREGRSNHQDCLGFVGLLVRSVRGGAVEGARGSAHGGVFSRV
jgi:hypothetical protein